MELIQIMNDIGWNFWSSMNFDIKKIYEILFCNSYRYNIYTYMVLFKNIGYDINPEYIFELLTSKYCRTGNPGNVCKFLHDIGYKFNITHVQYILNNCIKNDYIILKEVINYANLSINEIISLISSELIICTNILAIDILCNNFGLDYNVNGDSVIDILICIYNNHMCNHKYYYGTCEFYHYLKNKCSKFYPEKINYLSENKEAIYTKYVHIFDIQKNITVYNI